MIIVNRLYNSGNMCANVSDDCSVILEGGNQTRNIDIIILSHTHALADVAYVHDVCSSSRDR